METLAFGYGLVEAPCWAPDGSVLFSDVLGGGVHRWSPDGGVTTVVDRRRGVGGMALHADEGIVVSGRDLSIVSADGESRTVLAPDGVTGFNDLGTDARGRVFVGALHFHPFKGEPPVPGTIWALGGGLAEPTQVADGIDWANGIGFSPDGRTMYACDYAQAHVLAWDVDGDGALSGRRVFARSPQGSADGLAVDEQGAVLVALAQGGGIARFRADGGLDRVMDVPSAFVTSLCFGGADLRDLYVTTADNAEHPDRAGTLFRGRADVPGLSITPASV